MIRLILSVCIVCASMVTAWCLLSQRWQSPPRVGAQDLAGTRPATALVVEASAEAAPIAPDPDATNAALCKEGMVWIHERRCSAPLSNDDDCPEKVLSVSVCIDAFEYPNLDGALPATMVSYQQAEAACAAEQKHLCTEAEWTAACQQLRDWRRCNVGTKSPAAESDSDFRRSERVAAALAKIDGRWANAPAECVTDSGVHNLLGNVREWVVSRVPGYSGALRGGAFGEPVWNCARSLRLRDRALGLPTAGFRCCSRPLVTLPDDM